MSRICNAIRHINYASGTSFYLGNRVWLVETPRFVPKVVYVLYNGVSLQLQDFTVGAKTFCIYYYYVNERGNSTCRTRRINGRRSPRRSSRKRCFGVRVHNLCVQGRDVRGTGTAYSSTF